MESAHGMKFPEQEKVVRKRCPRDSWTTHSFFFLFHFCKIICKCTKDREFAVNVLDMKHTHPWKLLCKKGEVSRAGRKADLETW